MPFFMTKCLSTSMLVAGLQMHALDKVYALTCVQARVVPGSGRPAGRVGLGRVRNIYTIGGSGRVQTLAGRVGSTNPDPTWPVIVFCRTYHFNSQRYTTNVVLISPSPMESSTMPDCVKRVIISLAFHCNFASTDQNCMLDFRRTYIPETISVNARIDSIQRYVA